MKILAVDDDPFILELLTMMAGMSGFTNVETAESGSIALNILEESNVVFDCLLLDISMPGMNGIELCAIIRDIPSYEHTPIIMLTAMTEKCYVDQAFSAGATDYASKPFDITELHARLRTAQKLVGARKFLGQYSSASEKNHFDLFDEVRIDGIRNLIRYNALKNYLTQLSSAGMTGSQVVAIKIDHIETIYARASAEEFSYALTETADAITEALKIHGYMMAYAGNGTFLVISSKAALEASVTLEVEIQTFIDERETEYDDGSSLDIEISIGNPLRPSTSKTQRVRKTFDRAIARAENRMQRKTREHKVPNIHQTGKEG